MLGAAFLGAAFLDALEPSWTRLLLRVPGCAWALLGAPDAPGCPRAFLAAYGRSWRSWMLLALLGCSLLILDAPDRSWARLRLLVRFSTKISKRNCYQKLAFY